MVKEMTVSVSKALLDKINFCLNNPTTEEEILGEDDVLGVCAKFDDGHEIDIKCCGVQFHEGEDNSAWTEAVLFDHGSEVCCTEPSDEFLGDWELEDEGVTYVVHVVCEEETEC